MPLLPAGARSLLSIQGNILEAFKFSNRQFCAHYELFSLDAAGSNPLPHLLLATVQRRRVDVSISRLDSCFDGGAAAATSRRARLKGSQSQRGDFQSSSGSEDSGIKTGFQVACGGDEHPCRRAGQGLTLLGLARRIMQCSGLSILISLFS